MSSKEIEPTGNQEPDPKLRIRASYFPNPSEKDRIVIYTNDRACLLKVEGVALERVKQDVEMVLTRGQMLTLLNDLIRINNDPKFQQSGKHHRFVREDFGGVFGTYVGF